MVKGTLTKLFQKANNGSGPLTKRSGYAPEAARIYLQCVRERSGRIGSTDVRICLAAGVQKIRTPVQPNHTFRTDCIQSTTIVAKATSERNSYSHFLIYSRASSIVLMGSCHFTYVGRLSGNIHKCTKAAGGAVVKRGNS